MDFTTRPLTDLTWCKPEKRRASRFTASYPDTLQLLTRELEHLGAEDIVLEIQATAGQLRRDGLPKASAVIREPAVRLFFESARGPLMYRCDRYDALPWRPAMSALWQHNLRGIAMTLESLRAVERHGAAEDNEAYAGWSALPAGITGYPDKMAAAEFVRGHATAGADLLTAYNQAKRRLHPDRSKDVDAWHRLQDAGRVLGLEK